MRKYQLKMANTSWKLEYNSKNYGIYTPSQRHVYDTI